MKKTVLKNHRKWDNNPFVERSGFLISLGLKSLFSVFLMLSCVVVFGQLSGTKTINPAGSGANNYTTFTAAVNDLIAKGVNGAVVFNVSNGTYTEQISIPSITGSSATNTITFRGLTNDSSLVNLQFASTTTNNYVVQFQNADFIIFRNMSVQSTSTTNGNANTFNLAPSSTAEDCQGIQILSCRLSSIWGTSNAGSVVRASGKTTDLKIKNNYIGNSYGIYLQGQTTFAQYTTGIEIDSNVFNKLTQPVGGTNQEVFEPIYIQYANGLKIRFNRFTKTGCCADDLIQLFNSENFDISGNRADMTGGTYCITLSACGLNTTSFSQVYNNYLHFSYGGGTLLRVVNSRYLKVMHNNMLHDGTTGANRAISVDNNTAGSNVQIINNIISILNGIPIVIDRTATVSDLNNNCYYSPGGQLGLINAVAYTDLASMRGTVHTGSDSSSIAKDPGYASSANLDPSASCMVGKTSGINRDIYNVLRATPPSIGAKEVVSTAINDIALEAYVSPTSAFTTGAQDIVLTVKNYGSNAVSNYNVNYIHNGGSPVVKNVTTPLNACQQTNITFTGSQQATLTNTNLFTSYTSAPNGVTDTYKPNDTLRKGFCKPVSGNYTIDAAGSGTNNFKTFKDAVDFISCSGVNGKVVFTVAAGTYNEQIDIPFITGASATNTISFIGASKTTTILTYGASNASFPYTLRLNTSEYVTVRDMNIVGSGSVGWVVHLLNASNNKILNCKVELTGAGTSSTSTAYMGIILNGNNSSYTAAGNQYNNVIDSNEVSSGYYTVYSTHSLGTRVNYFRWNIILNGYNAGAYFNSAQCVKFIGNYISPRSSVNNDGLVLFNCNAATPEIHEIKNNIIRNAGTRGIYMATSTGSSGSLQGEIVNNLIGGGFRATTCYGVYTTSSRWKYRHNTFYLDNPGTGASRAFFQTTTGSTNDHLNNIYVVGASANTSAIPVELGATTSATVFDYNNYYNFSGTDLINIAGAIYNGSSYKGAFPSGGGVNSYNDAPQFISAVDPHLKSTYDAPPGDQTLGITTDVDGDARCAGSATIGADQSSFPTNVPVSEFVVADTVYLESSTRIVNTTKGNPNKYTYQWFVNGVLEATTRDLDFMFFATGLNQVVLNVNGCSGGDSSSQTVDVKLASTPPKSDFVVDLQVVDAYQTVNLRDLSKYGPTEWQWSASPASNALIFGDVSQNPSAIFTTKGFYDICLSTKNYVGAGNDTCKSGYIFVREEYSMCSGSAGQTTSSRFGRLFDDGGSTANYGTNRNCTYLINPCATSVTLKFSQFTLGTGDKLLIYDGANATGTLLGSFDNTSLLPGGANGLVAASGKMFINWVTDASGVAAGFVAEWTSVADNTPTPTADFSYSSPVYVDEAAVFTSTSTGNNLTYSWDFDPPFEITGSEGGTKNFDVYSYTSTGNYAVKLTVSNCAGSGTITKIVTVIDATTKPLVDFDADKKLVTVGSTVNFTDKSSQGPYKFKWDITPSSGVVIKPSATSRNISASFSKPGLYTVKLIAENNIGEDSAIKTNFIKVYDYCDPGVANIDGKTGISNVTFGAINNTSPVGVTSYTNYSNLPQYATVTKGGTYSISISRTNVKDQMNRKAWIDWNIDGDFDDSLEEVVYEQGARTLTYTGSIAVPTSARDGFTRLRVGVSYANDPNHPCGHNPVGEFEDYSVEVKADITSPVITLKGLPSVSIEQWYQYTDSGVTASDNMDGNLTSQVSVTSTVDSTKVGAYTVSYEVTDRGGNKTTLSRAVNVTPDVTNPVITLAGASTIKHRVKTTFADPGATATDYFNRNFTSFIIVNSNVNAQKTGAYTIVYEVTDLAGNKSTVTRIVEVMDDVAPVINKVGDTVVMEVKTPYIEPGVNAIDNYDSIVLVVSGAINTNVTGTNTLVYTATDASGNITTLTRVVRVVDTQVPVISLQGLDSLTLNVFTPFNEPGVKITDNYCANLVADVTGVVNTNKLGQYVVNYNVTDCEGNIAATKTRVVKVVDREAPILVLKGFATTTKVMRWVPYIDSGVVYSDNYYTQAELAPNVKTTSNVNYLIEGIYEHCYDLTDPSGNVAQRVCRIVEVIHNTTGMRDASFENGVTVYPNPTYGQLNIDVRFDREREVSITVMSLLGETVASIAPQQVIENNYQLQLGTLAAGMYLVRIESEGVSMVKKINLIH